MSDAQQPARNLAFRDSVYLTCGGLSVAALLVSQQGGLLAHVARPGGGTIFHFTLPAKEVRAVGGGS